ncbi:MAG: hypothetical protein AAF710_07055 [Planctomycetota bacterium]
MDTIEPKAEVNPWTEPVDADAAPPQDDAWSGDRPIWLALAGSCVAMAAAVPAVLIAHGGWVPVGHLLYVALLAGLLVGTTGLLIAGLVVGGMRVVRSSRPGVARAEGKRRGRGGLLGRLAFN